MKSFDMWLMKGVHSKNAPTQHAYPVKNMVALYLTVFILYFGCNVETFFLKLIYTICVSKNLADPVEFKITPCSSDLY
jgi:hypothetical protein